MKKSIALLISIVIVMLSCTALFASETMDCPNLTVESVSSDEVTLSWDPVEGETVGYVLERSTPDYPTMFQRIERVAASVYEATDDTVTPGRTYYYNVVPMGMEETYRIEVNTKKVVIPEKSTSKTNNEEDEDDKTTTNTTTPDTTTPSTNIPNSSSSSGTTSILTIGSTQMNAGENVIQLNAAPKLENGITMVPLRAISEALGAEVIWEPNTQTIIIIQK